MRLGITFNAEKESAKKCAQDILKRYSKNHEIIADKQIAEYLGMNGKALADMDVDMVITVGGDGTILRALHSCKAPVLGINTGQIGFLSEVEPEEIESSLASIEKGEYWMEERTRLSVCADGKKYSDVVNEFVLHTASISKIRDFSISIDDEKAFDVRADGIIIAPPTGSTSYALSAGGPILDPNIEAIVIALIAPIGLSKRPVVVSDKSVVRIRLLETKPCIGVFDGQSEEKFSGAETFEIKRSNNPVRVVRIRKGFFNKVFCKLVQ